MSDNKKYYYLKLKENFFETPRIKYLEQQENGFKYSNILLKLYLKSLRHNGKLMITERIPYDQKMIASITDHDIDTVRVAIELFKELELIDVVDNEQIYISDIQNFVGKGSTEADRIRSYRREIKQEKVLLIDIVEEDIKIENVQMYDKCTPEYRDKSLDIYKTIVEYLNKKTGKAFRSNTSKTKKVINARLRERYTIDDFKNVIDVKCKDWLNDIEMSKFLRPETLFGTKFENYLNEVPVKKVVSEPVTNPLADRVRRKIVEEGERNES